MKPNNVLVECLPTEVAAQRMPSANLRSEHPATLTEEAYGFGLVGRPRDVGLEQVQEGTVHPALIRMERNGELVPRLARLPARLARKYYRPSDRGLHVLAAAEDEWQRLAATLTRGLGTTDWHPDGHPDGNSEADGR